jgi:hypothetical protein
MWVLVLGRTRFIGARVVKRLIEADYEVVVFHRGQTEAELPPEVRHIHGERSERKQMASRLEKQGHYAIVETQHENRALVLNDQEQFAWLHTREGDLLVRSETELAPHHTVAHGRFFYFAFQHDPRFADTPRLFLQEDGRYWEFLLPEGLPTERDAEKPIAKADEVLTPEIVESYISTPPSSSGAAPRPGSRCD